MIDYRSALFIAADAHAGQVDKLGEPYIGHPIAVAANLHPEDERGRVAALLHDVLEDTSVNADDLRAAGADDELIATLDALTHRRHESRVDYITRIMADPVALRVKLADLDHNTSPERMAALPEETRERLVAKYARDRAQLLGP